MRKHTHKHTKRMDCTCTETRSFTLLPERGVGGGVGRVRENSTIHVHLFLYNNTQHTCSQECNYCLDEQIVNHQLSKMGGRNSFFSLSVPNQKLTNSI